MPSKSKSKSKSKPKSDRKADDSKKINAAFEDAAKVLSEKIGNMSFDDNNISSTLRAAKGGSAFHLMMLPQLMHQLSPTQLEEATALFYKILDDPAFSSKKTSSTLSHLTHETALYALMGLGEIPEAMLAGGQSPYRRLFEQNWSKIYNAIQYYFRESYLSSRPNSIDGPLASLVAAAVPAVIANIAMDDDTLRRKITKDSTLLEILIRIWLTPDDAFIPSPTFRRRFACYQALAKSFLILEAQDSNLTRPANVVHGILIEPGWDNDKAIKVLVQYCWEPEKAAKQTIPFAVTITSMTLMRHLILGQANDDLGSTNKFMDKFIRNGALPVVLRWLKFIGDDLQRRPEERSLSREDFSSVIRNTCGLLYASLIARNGPHWAVRLFDLGFLPALAHMLSSDHYWNSDTKEPLTFIFRDLLPRYLCHRLTVASAMKTVKRVTESGEATKLEKSFLRDAWMTFTNVLLERIVIYTACNRDFGFRSGRICENCQKSSEETSLFKCAGCKDATYCSRDCQTVSWKTGGHREQCEKSKRTLLSTGMRMPTTDNFSSVIALAEIRRHMPGLSRHLKSEDNPSGIPLEDAFFSVTLRQPTTVKVRAKSTLPADHHWHRRSFDRNDHTGPYFEVLSYTGGKNGQMTCLGNSMPPNFSWFPHGKSFNGDAKVGVPASDLLRRIPAQDGEGKSLAFALDEVDLKVLDARMHFQPPVPGDAKAPKTIYDFLEEKVKADLNILVWLGYE